MCMKIRTLRVSFVAIPYYPSTGELGSDLMAGDKV
jgi:hypothetical protein